jgi:hypothetical protein
MKVDITWVERGTNNAACIGHDEKGVEADSVGEAAENCLHYAEEAGIDLERYEPVVEVAAS